MLSSRGRWKFRWSGHIGSAPHCQPVWEWYRLVTFVLMTSLVVGCKGEVGYQPPYIPILISIDTEGNISASISERIVTSIGTFSVSTSRTISSIRSGYSGPVLIVRVDEAATVYELTQGEEFRIHFDDERTPYKRVGLIYEVDGDIVLELESTQVTLPELSASKSPTIYQESKRPILYPTFAERITFSPGSTSSSLTVNLTLNEPRGYVLRVLAGQQMRIATSGSVDLVLFAPDKRPLTPLLSEGNRMWSYGIPETGDYTVVMHGAAPVTFSIEIPPLEDVQTNQRLIPSTRERITFSPGSVSYTFSAILSEDVSKAYVLRVLAGQQVFVVADRPIRLVALDANDTQVDSVFGDGTRWSFPAMQSGDYTIVLSGTGDVTVSIEIPPL